MNALTEPKERRVADPRTATLGLFSPTQVDRARKDLGKIRTAPWPRLEGCLAVLFTARTGSTFLTRELEVAFDIGRMGETLNPRQVRGRTVPRIVEPRRDRWFAFKGGPPGVIVGELTGFFEAYMDRTSFIRVVRHDIVAQAISLTKAMQTRQWHDHNPAVRPAFYDRAALAKAVRKIAKASEQLRKYAGRSGRPCKTVAYEDISGGELTAALAAGDALGVPRLSSKDALPSRPVERVRDPTGAEWRARFLAEMDPITAKRIEKYAESIRS